MRPVLHGDVSVAARALLAVSQRDRHLLCTEILAEAELADLHLRRTGRTHPSYGNGSLMAAARVRALADATRFDDPDYCQCFELVLRQLIRFQISQRRN